MSENEGKDLCLHQRKQMKQGNSWCDIQKEILLWESNFSTSNSTAWI